MNEGAIAGIRYYVFHMRLVLQTPWVCHLLSIGHRLVYAMCSGDSLHSCIVQKYFPLWLLSWWVLHLASPQWTDCCFLPLDQWCHSITDISLCRQLHVNDMNTMAQWLGHFIIIKCLMFDVYLVVQLRSYIHNCTGRVPYRAKQDRQVSVSNISLRAWCL